MGELYQSDVSKLVFLKPVSMSALPQSVSSLSVNLLKCTTKFLNKPFQGITLVSMSKMSPSKISNVVSSPLIPNVTQHKTLKISLPKSLLLITQVKLWPVTHQSSIATLHTLPVNLSNFFPKKKVTTLLNYHPSPNRTIPSVPL